MEALTCVLAELVGIISELLLIALHCPQDYFFLNVVTLEQVKNENFTLQSEKRQVQGVSLAPLLQLIPTNFTGAWGRSPVKFNTEILSSAPANLTQEDVALYFISKSRR